MPRRRRREDGFARWQRGQFTNIWGICIAALAGKEGVRASLGRECRGAKLCWRRGEGRSTATGGAIGRGGSMVMEGVDIRSGWLGRLG